MLLGGCLQFRRAPAAPVEDNAAEDNVVVAVVVGMVVETVAAEIVAVVAARVHGEA